MNWISFYHNGLVNLTNAKCIRMESELRGPVDYNSKPTKDQLRWSIKIYFEEEGAYYERYFEDEGACAEAYAKIEDQLRSRGHTR